MAMDASALAMTGPVALWNCWSRSHDEATQVGKDASAEAPVLTTGVNVLDVPGFDPPSAAQPFTNCVSRNGISKAMLGPCHGRLLGVAGGDCIELESIGLLANE